MPSKVPKVVVIGGAYIDLAVRCSQIPLPGQGVRGSALSYTVTGPGPNQAAQAALCGCEVYLISKVGGDPFGQMARVSLEDFSINTDFVYTAEAKNTGVVVTLVNATGENGSCLYTGANNALRPEEIEAADQLISEANICLIHGRLPQKAIVTALRCAELHRTKVILNPARPIEQSRRRGSDLPMEYFSANILIPNLYEAGIRNHGPVEGQRSYGQADRLGPGGTRRSVRGDHHGQARLYGHRPNRCRSYPGF